MQRRCRFVPLSKQPLVLVLCQVRFSPIRQIAQYIPAIQEQFRRDGFPIELTGKVKQLMVSAAGIQAVDQDRWEYRVKDETWSILVFQDSIVLQTTAYNRFEGFADYLRRALDTVLSTTEHERLGVLQRVGLRYIDLIQPRKGEDYRTYLRSGLHGVSDDVFRPGTHRMHVESTGATKVGTVEGRMIVRIVQNDQGQDIPPDVALGAPKHTNRAKAGELVTLVDMDHFIEGNFDPDTDWVVEHAYEMHDHIVETFHEHVVTDAAIEAWR